MSNLQRIELRHRPDTWRDIVFITGAALLAVLALGSLTSKAAGLVSASPSGSPRLLPVGSTWRPSQGAGPPWT